VNVLAAILMAGTALNITVWPEGRGMPEKITRTLRCAPVGGSLPQAAAACSKLARMTRPFKPTPKNQVCTDIYGGPQEALITGRLRGYSVRATFNRKNGCELGRWTRVAFLFPGGISSPQGP
jgi:Subtilisin inhibitor-like